MDAKLKVKQKGNHCHVRISGEFTIYGVTELKKELLDHLDRSTHLEINLGDVEELDAAGFQLLYLLKREAKAANKKLSLVAHSAATLEVLEMFNMETFFGDPLVLAC